MANTLVRPDLYWGKSRSGKTTNVGLMAKWIHSRYGLATRLVAAEGEGVETLEPLIASGVIDLLTITRDGRFILEDIVHIVNGWWSKGGKMEAPTAESMKGIGAYAFESITSICDCVMAYQTADKSPQLTGTPQAKMLSTGTDTYVQDGGMKWRFAGMGDYGFIQRRAEEWIKGSARLGQWGIKKVVWTALEQKGKDDKGTPVYGPDLIGQAATGKSAAWFGLMAHFSFVQKEQQVDDPIETGKKLSVTMAKRLMWLAPHIEPDDPYKVPCLAGVRVQVQVADKVPPVMAPDVSKLYELLEEINATQATATSA